VAEPLRLALVGCGGIAHAYVAALQRVPTLQLAALVDPLPAARAVLVAPAGLPGFADVDALLRADLRPDAALVLTPPDSHERLAVRLLAGGLHVLCEKPLAPTVAAAERMFAAARAARRQLMLGSKFRYTADVTAARSLLAEQAIGEVARFENVFCSRVDMTQRWNGNRAVAGGGVLMDNGCHAVDLARFLLGPIARVQATFARRLQPLDVEDTACLQFVTGSGVLGTSDLSWSLQLPTQAYVRLHGSEGTIDVGWRQSRWQRGDGDWQVLGQGYDKTTAFAVQLADFAASCSAGATPRIDAADALAAVAVIDCAYRSAHEQRWIDVPPPRPLS
jgi:predicted dehydrogenase